MRHLELLLNELLLKVYLDLKNNNIILDTSNKLTGHIVLCSKLLLHHMVR